ncbi:MAG: primary-amine oxidase [Elusimicrobia bacterium]|nr:primary-amine oxidase [Elusimicrobiota bacterium]
MLALLTLLLATSHAFAQDLGPGATAYPGPPAETQASTAPAGGAPAESLPGMPSAPVAASTAASPAVEASTAATPAPASPPQAAPAVEPSTRAAAAPAPPTPPAKPAPPPHPLDPLNAAELARAAQLLRDSSRFPAGGLFSTLSLLEPSKEELERHEDGRTPPRRVFALVLDPATSLTYEGIVNLKSGKTERLAAKPGVHAGLLASELGSASEIVRADPGWQEALRRRGITNFSAVHLDGWASGAVGAAGGGPRLVRVLSFYKGKSSNFYARPVEGLVAVVDMATRKVVRLEDAGEVLLSQDDGAFDATAAADPKLAPKPLTVAQPEGPGFELEGWRVRWLGWSFRFMLHPREGPVLYEVAFDSRSILHRASLSELVAVYGDPAPAWSWRGPLVVGEYGMGRLASPLEAGSDAPANALLLDVDLVDELGAPYALKRGLALYERDGGLLWRHFTREPESNESRRGRELVLGAIATVGSYDYGLNWIFRQDGALEFQAELTGVPLAKGVPTGGDDLYGHHVSSRVAAPHHQHFFNVRLDFDVDGRENALFESATLPMPDGPHNPEGNAFGVEVRPLRTELEARRTVSLEESRKWLVASRSSAREGRPGGYLLVPGENSLPYARPGSPARRRAGFLDYHLWATRYNDEERYASGGEGLPLWTENDEKLDGKDLVLWYTFGVTRTPRPEDWPVMPAHRAGFRLLPSGFFSRNPALRVPR